MEKDKEIVSGPDPVVNTRPMVNIEKKGTMKVRHNYGSQLESLSKLSYFTAPRHINPKILTN